MNEQHQDERKVIDFQSYYLFKRIRHVPPAEQRERAALQQELMKYACSPYKRA